MILLQIDTVTASNSLLQYGVLGVFAMLLVGALVFVFKLYTAQHESQIALMREQIVQLNKSLDEERDKREKLEDEFHKYTANDSRNILTALNKNNELLENVSELLLLVKAQK